MVALDERGISTGSEKFAHMLRQIQEQGYPHLVFIIGGADGLDEPVRQRANLLLSFGQMTWPHQLVRVLLAEQLYRAHTILTGHPYHKI